MNPRGWASPAGEIVQIHLLVWIDWHERHIRIANLGIIEVSTFLD
jgi:hypothetical protein